MVVDDDALVVSIIEHALIAAGYEVVASETAADASVMLHAATNFAAMIAGINLSGTLTGWDIAKHAHKRNPDLPILYLTSEDCSDFAERGVANSAVLKKPFRASDLTAAVSHLLAAG